jgi:5-oxoprolinase (ATP-hydrolysing) subunit A
MSIDLNCDLGEGCPHDAELMTLITSANVACGGHAGEPAGIFATLTLAKKHGVQVGAHPGYPDKERFGRRELAYDSERVFQECLYQIGALLGLAKGVGVSVRYLKPHGALYNQACRDATYAEPVVRAAVAVDLAVMGLPGSILEKEAKRQGRQFIAEGFADRRYQDDGTLVPRSQPNAMIETAEEAVTQAKWLIRERGVETICVHGDNEHAVQFVRRLRESLTKQGIELKAFET